MLKDHSHSSSYSLNSKAKTFDKEALKILYGLEISSSKPDNVCNEILSELISSVKSGYALGVINSKGRYIDSNHIRLKGNCLIENKLQKHRVIVTDISGSYKYYSCVYNDDDSKCKFE